MLYARVSGKPRINHQRTESYTINPENESVKVDGKNWVIEASGLITWIVVIGFFVLAGAYIYGKFFHERVRGGNA